MPSLLFGYDLSQIYVDEAYGVARRNPGRVFKTRAVREEDLTRFVFLRSLLHMAGGEMGMQFGDAGASILVALHLQGKIDLDVIVCALRKAWGEASIVPLLPQEVLEILGALDTSPKTC